jgi:hypothetical protein
MTGPGPPGQQSPPQRVSTLEMLRAAGAAAALATAAIVPAIGCRTAGDR